MALGSPTNSALSINPGTGTFQDMGKNLLNAGGQMQGPDYSGLNQLNPGGYTENRNQATQTAQNYFNKQLDNRFQKSDQDFAQKMANQGIDAGSAAYARNKELYDKEKNNAYQDAAFQAYQAGGLEQQQAFNQGFQTRQQGANEIASKANFGLGQLGALLGGAGQFGGFENQKAIQDSQNKFQQGENTLDRKSNEAIAGSSNALALQILAQLGLSPTTPPNSPV